MNKLLDCCGNQKIFRPKKCSPSGCKGLHLREHIDAKLDIDLKDAVALPQGIDYNEWLAFNTDNIFEQVGTLYNTLTEVCTKASCPIMSAGPKYKYRWADGFSIIRKPKKVSAPEYVDYLMDWIAAQLKDESVFPQNLGVPFPRGFKSTVKIILKRVFHVYAHIYHAHMADIIRLEEKAHLNTCFQNFLLFTSEFNLIRKKELAPLQDIIEPILES